MSDAPEKIWAVTMGKGWHDKRVWSDAAEWVDAIEYTRSDLCITTEQADARAGALLDVAWTDFLALHTAAFAVLTWFENARPDLIGPRIEKLRDVLRSDHFRPDPDATAALAQPDEATTTKGDGDDHPDRS